MLFFGVFFSTSTWADKKPSSIPPRNETTPSLEEARALAQRARRTLVLEFGARWCGPCKEFDRRVLPLPAVKQALSTVLFIHYDAEESPGREAARTMQVIGYPTFLALGQDGRLIDRQEGYRSAREFLEWLGRVAADFDSDETLQVRIHRDANDLEALLLLGRRQAQHGRDGEAEATLARAAAVAKNAAPTEPQAQARREQVAAAIDWELRIVRLRRLLRDTPRREMAEHLLAFPRGPHAETAFRELVRRGPADPLTARALDRYIELRLDAKDQKGQDLLNEAVYGCLRAEAYAAAERAARRLLSLDENNPLFLDTLAEVLHLRGDRSQAMALSSRAVAIADKQGEGGRELRTVLLKNQARFARAAHELPAELLSEEDELSPWERSLPAVGKAN